MIPRLRWTCARGLLLLALLTGTARVWRAPCVGAHAGSAALGRRAP